MKFYVCDNCRKKFHRLKIYCKEWSVTGSLGSPLREDSHPRIDGGIVFKSCLCKMCYQLKKLKE